VNSKVKTSDVNFAAYLLCQEVEMLDVFHTSENNRVRVWFTFAIDDNTFKKHKNSFFSGHENSRVKAYDFVQERDRVYSLMMQHRNVARES